MTAILISREKTETSDTLYLAADRRVTSDDMVISDNNRKIFTYGPCEAHQYTRHYITVGDVSPTDYLIHKIEQLASIDALYSYMFETDVLTKMTGTIVFYVVDEEPGKPKVLQISKYNKRSGIVNLVLDEIITDTIFDGSGGTVVAAAFKVLADRKDITFEDRIQRSFTAAASVISSMNDTVDLIKIPIFSSAKAKTRKKKVKLDEA